MKQIKLEVASMAVRQARESFTRLGILLVVLLASVTLYGQTKNIVEGTVTSDLGEPLIGVSVLQPGTTTGTITDIDGKYKISVSEDATLEFSYMGFVSQQVKVGQQKVINIVLQEDSKVLDEVVVTALGIKREKKALGYAVQEVSGNMLAETREVNVTNALSGKVAGLQVIRSSNGPGGSSKINIRGNTSLTGDNQPLIVVDGIPMDNEAGVDNESFWNRDTDMGNGLSNIAPEDIESMSVLKGGSAAALYGYRAGNGVILITTKTGSKRQGLGLTISGSVGLETEFMRPKMQQSYGQGMDGVFDGNSVNSWGQKIGTEYKKLDETIGYMKAYDNLSNYFRTGTNFTENVSFSQQYQNTSVYVAFNRLDDNSRIPNSKFERTNATARAVSKFGKDNRWTLDAKIQYSNTHAENRPLSGVNDSNKFYTMYNMPVSLDIRDYKQYENEYGQMNWWSLGNGLNPYWTDHRLLNQDTRDRFMMFASLKYQFTDWLNAEVKAGSDFYSTETESKTYAGSPLSDTGRYSIGQDRFYENNYSFLVIANKDNLFDKFGGTATFGGNLMMRRKKTMQLNPDELRIPNFFYINNSNSRLEGETTDYQRKTNSLYGMLQLNYDGWAFLDVTARNDWASTMSKANRSYFYPSVSLSWVISDMLNKYSKPLPSWIDFVKVRGSWAEVGNGLEEYQLKTGYTVSKDPSGLIITNLDNNLYNEDVVAEKVRDMEVGLEAKFFGNRLGIDFAWYKKNTHNQLIPIDMDPMSGYQRKMINAGNIQSSGIEFMVNARPLELKNGLTWDMMVNLSTNKNKIIELHPKVSQFDLANYDNITITAKEGGYYGEIWGTTFLRVEDENSEHYGKLLLTQDGLPQMNSTKQNLGNQQSDLLMGITNTLSYKGITFSFLIDARFGGKMYSGTHFITQARGTSDVTAPGGVREDMILDGVYKNADGGYTVNTDKKITTQQYWQSVAVGNTGITEANVYDASNVRLRNISLSYDFPRKMLSKTPFQQLRVGVSCNNVWMIKSHMNGLDPESVFGTRTNATGFEMGSNPTSRSYIFNVTLGF